MSFLIVTTVIVLCLSSATSLDCVTSNQEEVQCTAKFYQNSNCSSEILKAFHSNLYGEELYPGKPNFTLTPIQEVHDGFPLHGYYPGFLVSIKPPKTADFKMVKGFQLDFHYIPSNEFKRCVIVEINNKTLQSNNITFKLKIYPLPQVDTSYIFSSFSLPTPKLDRDKEIHSLYGTTTNSSKWVEGVSPTSEWRTTISYYPNEELRSVKFWFVEAPSSMSISSYTVTLSLVTGNDSTPEEKRSNVFSFKINETEYEFTNLEPGKYRIGIQAFDDTSSHPSNCRCKNQNSACVSCLRTVTGIIVIPDDKTVTESTTTMRPPSSTLGTLRPQSSTSGTLRPPSSNSETTDITLLQQSNSSPGNPSQEHILPSVLGVLGLFLVTLVVVGCYFFNRERIRGMLNIPPGKRTNNFNDNLAFTGIATSNGLYPKEIPKPCLDDDVPTTRPKVALVFAEENDSHRNVVTAFASYLQTHCLCEVEYFPWATGGDKFRWIAQTVDHADFHIFVASESAQNQYYSWKQNNLAQYKDLFIPYLSRLLNRFDSKVNYAFVRFDYSKDVLMPDELTNLQFMLMNELSPLLANIHGLNHVKDDLKSRGLPRVSDVSKTSAGRNLISLTNLAAKQFRSIKSREDSGYTSRNEYNSIEDKDWKEKQKHILNELVKKPSMHIQGEFLLGEDSQSLIPGSPNRLAENVSIAPAITIAEGGERQNWQDEPSGFTHLAHNYFFQHQIDSRSPDVTPLNRGQSDERNNTSDVRYGIEAETRDRADDSFFAPPLSDGDVSEEDLNTEFQLQVMDNINRDVLRQRSEDAVSGYSV